MVAKTTPLVEGVSTAEFAAYVARIGKVKENPERLMAYLIKHKHWSPFEHTFLTFKIRTSRAIGRELLRHRSFTFQELSQRYEEVLEMEPIELRKQAENNRQSSGEVFDTWLDTYEQPKASEAISDMMKKVFTLYEDLLKAGVARECARFILPECTSTTILMSGNLRSWIHFLELRDDTRAQKEAQEIAKEIKVQITKEVPGLFGGLVKE